MLSDNPHSGFYEAKVSRTLDQSGGNSVTSAQGGICVVAPETYSLQGSMIGRSDRNGPQGDGINKDVCFTLNATDHHCIAAPEADHYCTSKNSHHTVAAHEQANTLVASDWKDPPVVNDTPNAEPIYIVRRLTPVECARLTLMKNPRLVGRACIARLTDKTTVKTEFATDRVANHYRHKTHTESIGQGLHRAADYPCEQ